MPNETKIERVVDAIYDAAVEPRQWNDALTEIAALMSAETGLLLVFDPSEQWSRIVAALGFQHANLQAYETYYAARDPWRSAVLTCPHSMAAMPLSTLVPPTEFERSELWNDYGKGFIGAFYGVGAKMPLPDRQLALLGVHRPRDACDFHERDAQALQHLLPHLRRALTVSHRLAAAAAEQARALEALDALAFGVILTDAACRLLHANAAAEAILAEHDGLVRAGGGRLTAARPEETRRLHHLVATAARANAGAGPSGGGVALPRRPPRRPLATMVTPLQPERFPEPAGHAAAMLFVSDPDLRPPAAPETLRSLYGLTGAEARLALALAAGEPLERAASTQDISLNTARWHLKHVFQKVGVGHQGELVALIARLPTCKTPGDGPGARFL